MLRSKYEMSYKLIWVKSDKIVKVKLDFSNLILYYIVK